MNPTDNTQSSSDQSGTTQGLFGSLMDFAEQTVGIQTPTSTGTTAGAVTGKQRGDLACQQTLARSNDYRGTHGAAVTCATQSTLPTCSGSRRVSMGFVM